MRVASTMVAAALLVPGLLAGVGAHAEGGGLLAYVGVQSDDDSNTGAHVGLSYGLTEATWLSASAAFGSATTDSRSGSLSIDHRFSDLVSVSGGVGRFDGDDDIDSTTWRGSITLRPGPLRLSLLAERRQTDVTFLLLPPGGGGLREVQREDEADGYGARIGIDFENGVWLSAERMVYDHSLDIEAINRQVARANRFLDALGRDTNVADLAIIERRIGAGGLLVSSSTIANSGSLLDNSNTISLGFQGETHRFGIDYAADKSAADGASLDTWTGVWAFPIGAAGELELAVGHAGGDDVDGVPFAGITWFYYR